MSSSQSPTPFARVYEDHVWRVYGFFAYRVGDRETAEDLTQTTFERALRAWSRYDPRRASVATWLLAIAGNLLIDHHRRGSRATARPDRFAWEVPSRPTPGPEERFDGSTELLAALSRLGGREREVLALRYGGDLGGPEVAALLGLSLANVQQITSRALRHLRELLEEPAREPARAVREEAPVGGSAAHGSRGERAADAREPDPE